MTMRGARTGLPSFCLRQGPVRLPDAISHIGLIRLIGPIRHTYPTYHIKKSIK